MLNKGMSRGDIEKIGQDNASHTEVANILGSYKLYVNPEEVSIAVHLSNSGFWEAWITKWFVDTVQAGFVCVDVGANYGYYTRLLEKLSGPNGKVYAIEANPELFESLRKSIEDFPIEDGSRVILSNLAVADCDGVAHLGLTGNNLGGPSILDINPTGLTVTEWVEVTKTTLDKIVDANERIDLIKLDIEGAEPLAMKGMESMLDRVAMIVIEILPAIWENNPRFIHELFYRYNVTRINFSGEEEAITYKQLVEFNDLSMLVLRK
jgi:FkbM family methyltransferase